MARDKYGHYVNEKGVEIKASTSSSGKDKIDFYDKCAADPTHTSIHINYDSNTGKGTITDTTSGKTETTDVSCFLTTACMKQMQEDFDDNCYFLDILRWFRDKFVSIEDKNHYYEVAPIIVSAIDSIPEKNTIYQYIYENIVMYCVRAIENEEFDKAYTRYKNSVLSLEQQFTKPVLNSRLVKTLK